MSKRLTGLAAGTGHSQVIVTSNAHLNGSVTLDHLHGYSPRIGVSPEGLRAGSLSVDVKCHNGLLFLDENKRLLTDYSATNLLLTAIAATDPTAPSLNIAKEGQALICWPAEFVGCGLYTNASLETDLWGEVPGLTNRYFDASLDPAKFFKLIKQP